MPNTLPAEYRLKSDLLKVYNPTIRPLYNHSRSVTVSVDLAILKVIDVVSKSLVLSGTARYCLVLSGTAWYCLVLCISTVIMVFFHIIYYIQ